MSSSSNLCLVSLNLGAILWPSGLLCLLLDLDTYGGVDPLGVFPLFLKIVADIIAPKLSIIFHGLIHRTSFPVLWSANVTAIPKGAPSPDRENYRPVSITPMLSKLVSHKLSSFCKKCCFFACCSVCL